MDNAMPTSGAYRTLKVVLHDFPRPLICIFQDHSCLLG